MCSIPKSDTIEPSDEPLFANADHIPSAGTSDPIGVFMHSLRELAINVGKTQDALVELQAQVSELKALTELLKKLTTAQRADQPHREDCKRHIHTLSGDILYETCSRGKHCLKTRKMCKYCHVFVTPKDKEPSPKAASSKIPDK